MIQTKEIEFLPSQHFKLLAGKRLASSWYVYLVPFIFGGVYYLLFPEDPFMMYGFWVLGFVYPLWTLVYLYIHTTSDKNAFIAIKRYYIFDGDLITAFHKDNTESHFNLSDVIGVTKVKDDHLLYFSPGKFIFLPDHAIEKNDMDHILQQLDELKVSIK